LAPLVLSTLGKNQLLLGYQILNGLTLPKALDQTVRQGGSFLVYPLHRLQKPFFPQADPHQTGLGPFHQIT